LEEEERNGRNKLVVRQIGSTGNLRTARMHDPVVAKSVRSTAANPAIDLISGAPTKQLCRSGTIIDALAVAVTGIRNLRDERRRSNNALLKYGDIPPYAP
jgi:hypothetical protein